MMDKDPVSGNEIPAGGTAEGVRDDVNVNLSEGEYVIPENVVRYIGVEKLEKMVAKANADLEGMEANGRMGEPSGMSEEDMQEAVGLEFNSGGMVPNKYMSDFNPNQYALGLGGLGGGGQGGLYGPYTPKPTAAPAIPEAPAATPVEPVLTPQEEMAKKAAERDGNRSYEQNQDGVGGDPNSWMDRYNYETTTPEGLFKASMDRVKGGSGLAGVADKVGEATGALGDFLPGLKNVGGNIQNMASNPGAMLGALTGNPMLGVLGSVAMKGLAMQNVSEAMANAKILEAQGMPEQANQLRTAAGEYAKSNGIEAAAAKYATGDKRAETVMERYGDTLFGAGGSTSVAGGTSSPSKSSSSSSSSSSGSGLGSPTPSSLGGGGGQDLEDRSKPNSGGGFTTASVGDYSPGAGTGTGNLSGTTTETKTEAVREATSGLSDDDKKGGAALDSAMGISGLAKGGLVTKKKKRGLGRK